MRDGTRSELRRASVPSHPCASPPISLIPPDLTIITKSQYSNEYRDAYADIDKCNHRNRTSKAPPQFNDIYQFLIHEMMANFSLSPG